MWSRTRAQHAVSAFRPLFPTFVALPSAAVKRGAPQNWQESSRNLV
jgi:hypothetical protein